MILKRNIAIASVILAALSAAFWFAFLREPVELTIVFPEMDASQRDFILPLVNGFQEEMRGSVFYSFKSAEEMGEEIAGNGEKADLYYFVKNYQVRDLKEKGYLSPFEIKQDKEIPSLFYSDEFFVPVSWYPWGIYYNKSYLEKLGEELPETFEEFVDLSSRYKVSLLSRIRWTSSIWLDYLDLKLNGYDFHNRLLSGEIPFTDSRVNDLFQTVGNLVDTGLFEQERETASWENSIAALKEERALFCLSGSFFYEEADIEFKKQLGWIPFPGSDTAVLSSSGFVSPDFESNKRGIKVFLKYVQGAEGQRIIQKHSRLISIRPEVAATLEREDLEAAFASLDSFTSYVPSFERNSHEKLSVPFKNIFHSLILNPPDDKGEKQIAYLEKMRSSIEE